MTRRLYRRGGKRLTYGQLAWHNLKRGIRKDAKRVKRSLGFSPMRPIHAGNRAMQRGMNSLKTRRW